MSSARIHLDFETRSRLELRGPNGVGAWRYSEDPSTEIICLRYRIGQGEMGLWRFMMPPPQDLFDAMASGQLSVAHNAFFELSIWMNICEKRMGWPPMPMRQRRCTAAKAAALSLPRALGKAGKVLSLTVVKDEDGKSAMMRLTKPRKPSKKNPYPWNADPQLWEKTFQYCADDVLAEEALDNALRDLDPKEQEVWFADQDINLRGVYIDLEAVKGAIRILEAITEEYNTELALVTGGEVESTTLNAQLLKWVQAQGAELTSLAANEVDELLGSPAAADLPAQVRRALELRRLGSKSSSAKYKKMLMAVALDGRLRDLHMYHGAKTGRWAGKLVQMQNLPKGKLWDMDAAVEVIRTGDLNVVRAHIDTKKDKKTNEIRTQTFAPTELLSYAIRGMFIAAPGKKFIVADYASIEARVVFWLAEEQKGLTVFLRGEDIYKEMASRIYNVAITAVTPDQRQIGKFAILGLGFGMGWEKFMATCANFGVVITEEFAREVVRVYRGEFTRIPALWKLQEEAAILAVQTGQIIPAGKCTWFKHGDFLYCRLPSGRKMAYFKPELRPGVTPWGETKMSLWTWVEDSMSKQWKLKPTYGGSLVENCTQAIARDFLAEAMLRCESSGYPIAFHVHDEIVAEVADNDNTSVEKFIELLTELPEWGEGCPIAAEGWQGYRYRK